MNNVFKMGLILGLGFAGLPELSAADGEVSVACRRTGGSRLQYQEIADQDNFKSAFLANDFPEASRILDRCKFRNDFLGVMLASAIAENKEKFVSVLLKEGAVVRFADLQMAQDKKDAADELFLTAVRWMEPVDVSVVISWTSIVEMLTNAQARSAEAVPKASAGGGSADAITEEID